ncbi:MAG: C-terminal binding protein, partial [Oscillospiraceae bacterium]|nr:C-terminal binding protein [Oscillospiraceae bacterium]
MALKVVLTDHVFPNLDGVKAALDSVGAELVYLAAAPGTTDEQKIADAVVDADAVITCYAGITAKVIEGMTKCRSISKTGIGVNNIDVAAASAKGIRVLNQPDYCVEEVSDHTVALILAAARRIVS